VPLGHVEFGRFGCYQVRLSPSFSRRNTPPMTSQVRIYRQAKTTMQSGRATPDRWVGEFEPESRREVEPLMGWTSTADTRAQLRLRFDSQEEAVAYAK